MSEIKAIHCPFCKGTKMRIEMKKKGERYYGEGKILENYTATVRCNCCHARGSTVSGWVRNRKFVDEKEWLENEIDVSELHKKAVEVWNTRKPMQEICERLEDVKRGFCGGSLQTVYYQNGVIDAIEIVKEVGGMNEV